MEHEKREVDLQLVTLKITLPQNQVDVIFANCMFL